MDAPPLPPGETPGAQGELRAQLVVRLIQFALTAPDIPSAVLPALEALVAHTDAVGAAYFQLGGETLTLHAGFGVMPQGMVMDELLADGLPADTPLLRALERSAGPLFFTDTRRAAEAGRSAEAGVGSLAAAPVWNRDGSLLGLFLMYTAERHRWRSRERDLFGAVTWTLAALIARLVAEDDAIRALGVAVESRDPEVKGHIERVTSLAERVGRALDVDAVTLGAIRRGAYLHDLGKVATPDAILHKPGRLDSAERRVMERHAEAGHHVAEQLAFLPRAALDVVLYHHERWDGLGYPHGLKGEAIPLTARIFAVCDVYDALTSLRPYKAAWSHERAVAEIRAQAGRQFDPRVVEVFLGLIEA